jgi:hypothetical protein
LGQSSAQKQLPAPALQDVIAQGNTYPHNYQLQAACMQRIMQRKYLKALQACPQPQEAKCPELFIWQEGDTKTQIVAHTDV